MMKKNIMVEASERYREFQKRGLIPDGEKYVYLDFVKEVASERKDGSFVGRYTAKGYSQRLNLTVDYNQDEDYNDLRERHAEVLLDRYKEEFLELADKNDFFELSEKYHADVDFSAIDIINVNSFQELSNLMDRVEEVEPFLFRNVQGRNRTTESDTVIAYKDDFEDETRVLHDEVKEIMRRYEL